MKVCISRIFHCELNLVQDNVDDDIPSLYDHPAHVVQYDRLRLEDDENWQEFIQRARVRSMVAPRDDEEQAVAPRAGDKLWEIGCKVRDYPPSPPMLFTRK